MAQHEYSAQEALALLLERLESEDPNLASEVRASIDAGRDVVEREPGRGRRRRGWEYRRTVALTPEEALIAALEVLQAYFIEQPLFFNSLSEDFATAALAPATTFGDQPFLASGDSLASIGQDKEIVITLQPETQISTGAQDQILVTRVSDSLIVSQQEHLSALRQLFDFS